MNPADEPDAVDAKLYIYLKDSSLRQLLKSCWQVAIWEERKRIIGEINLISLAPHGSVKALRRWILEIVENENQDSFPRAR